MVHHINAHNVEQTIIKMAHKKEVKLSEARILVYLENVHSRWKFVGAIAAKIKTDYGYTLHILKEMHEKGWLTRDKQVTKSYYFLTKAAPLHKAKELLK